MKKDKLIKFIHLFAPRRFSFVFVSVFAIVGGLLLLLSIHAQSQYISMEAEAGGLANGATEGTDANASSQSYVKFGQATTARTPTIDPATPPPSGVQNNVPNTTSPTFSPPANTVIYAVFSMDSAAYEGTATTVTGVTSTGTSLTWHVLGRDNSFSSQAGGFLEVWWANNPTVQTNITATGIFSMNTKNVTPPVGDFQILVMDNAATDQSAAAWKVKTLLNSQNNSPTVTVTTTKANSQVMGVFDNWNNSERPIPGTNQSIQSIVLNVPDVDGYWIQKQNAPTTTTGTDVTMNATDPGQANQWHALAWEVLGTN